MEFGEKLMRLRKSKGMSQEELASKLNVTRQTVSKWELEQTVPDMNKLIEISKEFAVSLDELTNTVDSSDFQDEERKETHEKANKKISVRVFIIGLAVSLILCGVGLAVQVNAKKTNEERAAEADVQYQQNIDNAKKRLEEIEDELVPLKEQYEEKNREADEMDITDPNWFSEHSRLKREATDLYTQITELEMEQTQIQNEDYTVYYPLVKPITYFIIKFIAAGEFVVLSIIALIYFLVTRIK